MAEQKPLAGDRDPRTGRPYVRDSTSGTTGVIRDQGESQESYDARVAEQKRKDEEERKKREAAEAAAAPPSLGDVSRRENERQRAPSPEPTPTPTPTPTPAKEPKRSDFPEGLVGEGEYNKARLEWNKKQRENSPRAEATRRLIQ